MRKHSLFVLYNLYKDSNSERNFKEKALKNDFSSTKTFYKPRVQLDAGVLCRRLCQAKNARTAPVVFAPRRVSHIVFLIILDLEQTSKDYIGNTEHSNVNVTMSAIVYNFCTLADPNGVQ